MKRTVIGFIAPQHLIDGFGPVLSKFLNNRSFKVKTYTSRQELEEFMANEILSEFCFALEFSDIFPGVPEVNVTYMLPLDVTMNTASPLYDLTAGVPDYWNYNSTFHAGTLQLKVMITDLLINLMTGHSTSEIELAVTPFKTPEFSQLEPFAS